MSWLPQQYPLFSQELCILLSIFSFYNSLSSGVVFYYLRECSLLSRDGIILTNCWWGLLERSLTIQVLHGDKSILAVCPFDPPSSIDSKPSSRRYKIFFPIPFPQSPSQIHISIKFFLAEYINKMRRSLTFLYPLPIKPHLHHHAKLCLTPAKGIRRTLFHPSQPSPRK